MNDAAAALEVEDLRKRFGSLEVLKGVSLTARNHDVISIIGSSGSGKSTFLRCLNFLETPDAGRIVMDGEEITLRPENTASVVRAMLSGGLLQNLPLKYFYAGPMFRHERPQKGRQRQFHQIGMRAFQKPQPLLLQFLKSSRFQPQACLARQNHHQKWQQENWINFLGNKNFQ